MEIAAPMLRIHGFTTKYRRRAGQAELIAEDWIKYSPLSEPNNTITEERVKVFIPPEHDSEDHDEQSVIGFMRARWAQIGPAYERYKAGHAAPETGTGLALWSGVLPEQAEILKRNGYRTVEEVAAMNDGAFAKVMLPNLRALRDSARAFLDAKGTSDIAARLNAKDEEIAILKAQQEEILERLKTQDEVRSDPDLPKRGPGRPPKVIQAEQAA